jgi:Na+-translocating ferredoxin:NAD+ oxidoreductase RnfD subunit
MEGTGSGALNPHASTVAGSGTVDKVDLAAETAKAGFANFNREEGKHKQRWMLLWMIGGVFVALNAAVVWLIYKAMAIDVVFFTAHPDLVDKRLITSAVFQTLIGATVVDVTIFCQ